MGRSRATAGCSASSSLRSGMQAPRSLTSGGRTSVGTHSCSTRLSALSWGILLEALIAAGELDEAEEILATWHERASALDRAWALAILARCRGLLLAARGDLDGAFVSFERSLAEHDRTTDPFQHARTLLALGQDAEAREEAWRRPRDSRGRAGRLRAARRAALGRTDPRRAHADRRACPRQTAS